MIGNLFVWELELVVRSFVWPAMNLGGLRDQVTRSEQAVIKSARILRTCRIGNEDYRYENRSVGVVDHNDCEPNQSMKPAAPLHCNFSVFATTPCRGLSLSR